MKKPVVLRIFKGDQLLGVKQFMAPQIVIGQPGDVQVPLEGESVSLIHASIEEREPGKYFVSDLGSATGTLKNGATVLDAALESGDTLNVGDYKIEFYIGPPKPKAVSTFPDGMGPVEIRDALTDPFTKIQPLPPLDPATGPGGETSLDKKLSEVAAQESKSEPKPEAPIAALPPVVLPAARPPAEDPTPVKAAPPDVKPEVKAEVKAEAPPAPVEKTETVEQTKPVETPVATTAAAPTPVAPAPPVAVAPPAVEAPPIVVISPVANPPAATPPPEPTPPPVTAAPPIAAAPPAPTTPVEAPPAKPISIVPPIAPVIAGPKVVPAAPATPQAPAPTKPTSIPPSSARPAAFTPPAPKVTASSPKVETPKKPTTTPSMAPPRPQAGPAAAASAIAGTGGGFGLVGPRTGGRGPGSPNVREGGRHKKRKTFAPPSKHNDVKDYIKPSKGTVVEILVAWRERVIATHHFTQSQTITIGSHPTNDIVMPLFGNKVRRLPIVKIDKQAIVILTPEMRGELIKGQTSSTFAELIRTNRLGKSGNSSTLPLEQGEMVRIEMSEDVSVIIRYVSDSPKPMIAPLMDLTATETTGIILAFALVATLKLYMFLYQAPKGLPSDEDNQPVRTAMIVLTPPTPPPIPPPQPTPVPTPVAAVPTPAATPPPVKIKVAEVTKAPVIKKAPKPTATNLTTKKDPGASAAAAPNKNKTGPREQTSVKQGGAIKTSKTEGSQMKSKPARDVTKMGAFSAFANGGQQDQLAQGTSGSGELAGMANAATGKTGSATDRAGKGLGSELKDTGMGGNGKALQGIAGGVGTTGRGSGISGTGEGGLGNKAGTKIVTGGAGEEITGTIDREAIRRVIRANLPAIKACYERELNRKPDLFGKLVISWDIGEQGRVLGARVKSNELGSDAVAQCVIAKLKTWTFPEPPANQVAEVSYPFLFSN